MIVIDLLLYGLAVAISPVSQILSEIVYAAGKLFVDSRIRPLVEPI